MTELLPCPFCGSANIIKNDDGHQEWIECTNCGATGPWIEPPEDHDYQGDELEQQWNFRPALAAVKLEGVGEPSHD